MAGGLANLIPHPVPSAVLYGILYVLASVLTAGTAVLALFLIGFACIRFIRKNQADEISVFAAVIDLACILFMADEIKQACSVNLLLLMMLIFLIYSVICGVIEMNNKELRNEIIQCTGIIAGFIGGVGVMIRLLGAWSLVGTALVLVVLGNKK